MKVLVEAELDYKFSDGSATVVIDGTQVLVNKYTPAPIQEPEGTGAVVRSKWDGEDMIYVRAGADEDDEPWVTQWDAWRSWDQIKADAEILSEGIRL